MINTKQLKLDQNVIENNKGNILAKFGTSIQKLSQQPVAQTQTLIQNWPENSDFAKVVASAPDIPQHYQMPPEKYGRYSEVKYKTLKDKLKWSQPVLSFGRLLFVVPKMYVGLDGTVKQKDLDKYKTDIMLALNKIKSTPTGAAILKAVCEPGLPVLVNLQTGGHAKNNYKTAESIDEKNNKAFVFEANTDELSWSPCKAVMFKNPDGSIARVPTWLTLLHELGHLDQAHKDRKKDLVDAKRDKTIPPLAKDYKVKGGELEPNGTVREENRNTVIEQQVAKEAGDGLIPRTNYREDSDTMDVASPLTIPNKDFIDTKRM